MAKRWPVGSLILCLVVVASSFLPWGRLGLEDALDRDPAIPEFARSMASSFGVRAIPVTAWNSSVHVGALEAPNWVVPVVAAFLALFLCLRAASVWAPPRVLSPALCLAAEAQTVWIAIVLATSKGGAVGIGVVATLAALACLFVAELRSRETSPAPAG
jgi:hypothetical protein